MFTVNKMDLCIPSNHSHSKPICSLHPHSGVNINLSCSWRHKKCNLSNGCFTLGRTHHDWTLQGTITSNRSVIWAWALDTIIWQSEGGVGEMKHRERERGNNREVCGRNNGVTYWWNSSLRTLETCLMPVWQQILLQNISLSASRFPLSLCQVSTLYVAEPACKNSVVIHTFKTHLLYWHFSSFLQ